MNLIMDKKLMQVENKSEKLFSFREMTVKIWENGFKFYNVVQLAKRHLGWIVWDIIYFVLMCAVDFHRNRNRCDAQTIN